MGKSRNRLGDLVDLQETSEKNDGNAVVTAKPMAITTMATSVLQEGAKDNAKFLEMIHSKYGSGKALPCLILDPSEIRVGRFFNRLPQSFDETKNTDFAELLDDVKRTGGNLVSGLVRPYKDESNPKIKYELVFGERRLKACIKAGVHFKAEIAEISDAEFIQLHSTENRFRPQLSIVESALQFKSWLEKRKDNAGKRVSVEAMASEIGYSQQHFYRLQAIGKIDENVLFGIPGVESLSVKETDKLCKAWNNENQRKLILSRLNDLAKNQLKGKAAFEYLCKPVEANEERNSNKVSIKLPAGLNNRESLASRLKEIGTEFGVEIVVK